MIIDKLHNARAYEKMGERIAAGLSFLQETDFSRAPEGRIDIRGKEIYATINRYETKPREQGTWEAHRKYIDIQYLVEGNETIGFCDVADMKIAEAYDEEKDCAFFHGKGDSANLAPGMFAIFFPHDAHMPGISEERPETVTKVVVKVAVQ